MTTIRDGCVSTIGSILLQLFAVGTEDPELNPALLTQKIFSFIKKSD
jgi:hypothetical protein